MDVDVYNLLTIFHALRPWITLSSEGSDGWCWKDIVGISRCMGTGAIMQFSAIDVMMHWVKRTIRNEMLFSKMVYIHYIVCEFCRTGRIFPWLDIPLHHIALYVWLKHLPASIDTTVPSIITRNAEIDPGVIWQQQKAYSWNHWFNCYESSLYQCPTQILVLVCCDVRLSCWSEAYWRIHTIFVIFSWDGYFPQG